MKITEGNRATLIVVFIMVAFNGIFLSVNGLFMLVAPLVWYDFVPGVTDTGFFTTTRLKARIDFSLSVLNMLWWALGVNHRPT